jgi:mRNA-degrading endonuclease RelE of RelBE toxin-antitoxin system
MSKYEVRIKKKVARGLTQLPADVQSLLFLLITDLQASGPIQKSWRNFSPLGNDQYHLNDRYVACWMWRKNEIIIEVYYAGSREKAPY